MMGALWGLDCMSPTCVHDTITSYRLRFLVRLGRDCRLCDKQGALLPAERVAHMSFLYGRSLDLQDPQDRELAEDWYACEPCEHRWRRKFTMERRDMVFRESQLQSALKQMEVLGETHPGLGVYMIAGHSSLPPGYDARMLILKEEPLRKCCLYLRWRPENGEMLTPDKVFQCLFTPYATAAQRRNATARCLLPDEFTQLTSTTKHGGMSLVSSVKCQHCQTPLPLAAFNTSSLREVEIGD